MIITSSTEKPEEKAEAPEFIKVPEKVTVREHDNAKFLVKVIGQPKPTGECFPQVMLDEAITHLSRQS